MDDPERHWSARNIDYWPKRLTVLVVCVPILRFLQLYPTFREFNPDESCHVNSTHLSQGVSYASSFSEILLNRCNASAYICISLKFMMTLKDLCATERLVLILYHFFITKCFSGIFKRSQLYSNAHMIFDKCNVSNVMFRLFVIYDEDDKSIILY